LNSRPPPHGVVLFSSGDSHAVNRKESGIHILRRSHSTLNFAPTPSLPKRAGAHLLRQENLDKSPHNAGLMRDRRQPQGTLAQEKEPHHDGVTHSRSQPAERYDLPLRLWVQVALTGLDVSRIVTVVLTKERGHSGNRVLFSRLSRHFKVRSCLLKLPPPPNVAASGRHMRPHSLA
jgi:hypothetical protein